ncbi:hypothetical protein GN244_ATG11903 [Phytophthora infestans]|uniref:Uncharacterized protein n=1 Tax=Phytophthora infestans TaxID=4787 RepID=A0A833T8Z6_PHYIN|nr:hypothetical protein GN244_ATG11903 [Phytophthora infestans]KAF4145043.1 hypothetical protein GN958_ATG05750 [Phytophthora infestans]
MHKIRRSRTYQEGGALMTHPEIVDAATKAEEKRKLAVLELITKEQERAEKKKAKKQLDAKKKAEREEK